MESYFGYVETVLDALLIFEACRVGVLSRAHRRLTDQERAAIRSGSVFVWDEDETGIHRWTDGRSWSSSRARGSFLTYRELDDPTNPRSASPSFTSSGRRLRLKRQGLTKRALSLSTADGRKFHLISYYLASDVMASRLKTPRADPLVTSIKIPELLYPEL
ncbi:Gti1/Pac2 family-domain-containing protein, partial [Thamnocephalis sphaerospora]